MADQDIVNIWKSEVVIPNPPMVTGYFLKRDQINPLGLILKYWRWDSIVNYNSFIHPQDGVFCVLALDTIFFEN